MVSLEECRHPMMSHPQNADCRIIQVKERSLEVVDRVLIVVRDAPACRRGNEERCVPSRRNVGDLSRCQAPVACSDVAAHHFIVNFTVFLVVNTGLTLTCRQLPGRQKTAASRVWVTY